jgi:hypothetical protein
MTHQAEGGHVGDRLREEGLQLRQRVLVQQHTAAAGVHERRALWYSTGLDQRLCCFIS